MTQVQGNFPPQPSVTPNSVLNTTKMASVTQDALLLPTDIIALDMAETTRAPNALFYETPETMCDHDSVTDTEYNLLVDNFLPLPEPLDSMHNHNLLVDNFVPLPATPASPINIEKLKEKLSASYPDSRLADYLIQGFTYGFDIGYSGKRFPLRSKNLHSARTNASAVTEAISKELSCGHVVRPFRKTPFENLHCSSLAAVPKKDKSYHHIIDLSSPPGRFINDGVSKDDYSVVFSRFDSYYSAMSGQRAPNGKN